nr:hypothetical protein [Tanacetum cinerariifolium]
MVPSIIDHAMEKPSARDLTKVFLVLISVSKRGEILALSQENQFLDEGQSMSMILLRVTFTRATKPYNAPPPTSQAPPTTSQRGDRYHQLPPSAQWPPNHHDPLPDYNQRPPLDHYQGPPLAQWDRQMAIMPYQPTPPPQAPEMMDDRPHQPTP